jgi:hypothetical protein
MAGRITAAPPGKAVANDGLFGGRISRWHAIRDSRSQAQLRSHRASRLSRLRRHDCRAYQGACGPARAVGCPGPAPDRGLPYAHPATCPAQCPLFKSLHISDTDIAAATKMFGFWTSHGGTFLAGYVLRKVGLTMSLSALSRGRPLIWASRGLLRRARPTSSPSPSLSA